jgi:hypothetical protein
VQIFVRFGASDRCEKSCGTAAHDNDSLARHCLRVGQFGSHLFRYYSVACH